MTNKEAIAILTHNWKYRKLIDNPYQYEALDHAIKALEKMISIENLMETYAVDSDEQILLENIQAILGGYENEDNPE